MYGPSIIRNGAASINIVPLVRGLLIRDLTKALIYGIPLGDE